jgi:hypothetical protein
MRSTEHQAVGHPFSDAPLPFRQIVDCGVVGYHEFACSKATFEWLAGGAMRVVDGIPVRLKVADECVGGHNVFVKVYPREPLVRLKQLEHNRRLRVAA